MQVETIRDIVHCHDCFHYVNEPLNISQCEEM
jgi:hypothetical protein